MTLADHIFSYVLLAIGLVAVLTNLLLMWISRQLQHRSLEIRLAVALASVDLGLAILIIWTSSMNNWYQGTVYSFQSFCSIKGPIDFLLQYTSLVLVTTIAMERYYKVKGSPIPFHVWAAIIVCTAVYATLILVAAAQNEFSTSLSGYDCTPIAGNSILSALSVFSSGLFMFLCVLAAISAYLKILFIAESIQRGKSQISKQQVLIRVISISLIYLFLIVTASILIMLEGSRTPIASQSTDIIISILIALNSIANPCLTLFAHSVIFDQLKQSFAVGFSKECQIDPPSISPTIGNRAANDFQ